jgi:uroporphyrinogen decarboxylase
MNKAQPDFNRVITTLQHQEPDRVPLAEVAIDYEIMSQFLGQKVTDEDLAGQVTFWANAGYDYILLTAGLMRPGGVSMDSSISKVVQDTVVKDKSDEEDSWNIWKRARIHTEADFEAFPWQEAADLELSKFYDVQDYLPEGMKIIATSGKIFTMTWMLMGFDNFAANLKLNPTFTARVIERVAQIQFDAVKMI